MSYQEGTYKVVLTGFGPFMDVLENPSADIQKYIVQKFEEHFPTDSGVKLLHQGIIVVEADQVDKEISLIEEKIKNNKANNPNDRYLLLHLGVASKMTKNQLKLETRCFNARNFEDQNSYNEDYRVQIENDQELGAIYTTPINLQSIVDKPQRKDIHPKLVLNYNPGNYLCNYIQ